MNELMITIEQRTTVAERIAAFDLQTKGKYQENDAHEITNCDTFASIAAAYFYQKASDYREVIDMVSHDTCDTYLMKIHPEEAARFPYLEELDSKCCAIAEYHESRNGRPRIFLFAGAPGYVID